MTTASQDGVRDSYEEGLHEMTGTEGQGDCTECKTEIDLASVNFKTDSDETRVDSSCTIARNNIKNECTCEKDVCKNPAHNKGFTRASNSKHHLRARTYMCYLCQKPFITHVSRQTGIRDAQHS